MRRKGISLIETLISLTIVSLSVIALLPVMTVRKESNDLNRGNIYWEKLDTTNLEYYSPKGDLPVSIGALKTPENDLEFKVDTTGFKNSNLLPLNVTDRLDWDGLIIEAPDDNTLYMRIQDDTDLKSTQHIYIDSKNVIINNGTNANSYPITQSEENTYTKTIGRTHVYSLSNQDKEYLVVDINKNIIGIGENAGRDINENNFIGIFNKGETTINTDTTMSSSTSPGGLVIGTTITTEKAFSSPNDWIIHRRNDQDYFTINANLKANQINTSAVILPSDKRLKNILFDYTHGLNEILKIKPVEFTYKKDKSQKRHIGVIAQDLKKVLPEAVSQNNDGYYMVSTEPIFYSFINAIKELNNKNIELKKNNDKLEQKIAKLKEIKANLEKGGNDE